MSTWDIIEQTITAQPVALPLSVRELYAVREAHASWVRRTLDEASAWDVLEQVKILMEADADPAMTKAVKGLDPREVQLIRHFKGNAKSKTGNTGEVVALSPKEWLRIKQEIQAQPDYYDKLLGNVVSAEGLAKKIEDQIALAMGRGPSKLLKPDVKPPPELSGSPSDVTPAQHGAEQFGNAPPGPNIGQTGGGSPFAKKVGPASAPPAPPADDAAARRRRVAAQDAAMMGGKTRPSGKVTVK